MNGLVATTTTIDAGAFGPAPASELWAGFLCAGILLVLAGALLPAGKRIRARQGAVLFGMGLAALLARAVPTADPGVTRLLVFATSFFLLASIGRSLVVLLLDVIAERRTARPSPRIFRDLSTGVVYLFVGLLALRSVDVEPGSILTTSALLTAVVGLAMQDTLGNLVSGLALQLQRPFDVGDWVELDDGRQQGRVTEVTWRATTVMTLDHVEVILPNAGLAKASIRNYSRPSPVARRRVLVNASPASSPDDVHTVLVAAAREVPGVLVSPEPFARTRSFAESSIEYELLFFIDDFGQAQNIEGAVRDRVYYAFARAGVEMPFPTRTLLLPQVDPGARVAAERGRRASAIAAVPLLTPLPNDSRQLLIDRAMSRPYGPGEVIVRKGEASTDLFIIERGTVAVELPRVAGVAAELAQLGAGQCFGEMGLLTGETRSATVRARTRCDLIVIDREAFHEVLAAHPEVVDRMGALLASRQAEISAAEAIGDRGDRRPRPAARGAVATPHQPDPRVLQARLNRDPSARTGAQRGEHAGVPQAAGGRQARDPLRLVARFGVGGRRQAEPAHALIARPGSDADDAVPRDAAGARGSVGARLVQAARERRRIAVGVGARALGPQRPPAARLPDGGLRDHGAQPGRGPVRAHALALDAAVERRPARLAQVGQGEALQVDPVVHARFVGTALAKLQCLALAAVGRGAVRVVRVRAEVAPAVLVPDARGAVGRPPRRQTERRRAGRTGGPLHRGAVGREGAALDEGGVERHVRIVAQQLAEDRAPLPALRDVLPADEDAHGAGALVRALGRGPGRAHARVLRARCPRVHRRKEEAPLARAGSRRRRDRGRQGKRECTAGDRRGRKHARTRLTVAHPS
jgi:small-conductance mechanosensitive channel/CRP-like cAMP-binding protein